MKSFHCGFGTIFSFDRYLFGPYSYIKICSRGRQGGPYVQMLFKRKTCQQVQTV